MEWKAKLERIKIMLDIFKLSGVRQYLHRMVVCLDSEILPFVPVAMESLMKNADAKELYDFIPLINQLVCKFKVGIITSQNGFSVNKVTL